MFLALGLPQRAWKAYLDSQLEAEALVLFDIWAVPGDCERGAAPVQAG